MIAEVDRFVLSKAPYAVQPDTFEILNRDYTDGAGTLHRYRPAKVAALWVRRTKGRLGVHTGYLGGSTSTAVSTFEEFAREYSNARYGGTVLARWDGQTLWTPSPVPRTEEDELLAVLDPALRHLAPLIAAKADVTAPDGWSGWFQLVEGRA